MEEKIHGWNGEGKTGVELLTMPNIPLPLFELAPRVVMGTTKWGIERTKCYMRADYTCEICGCPLGYGKCQAHEVYNVDYNNHTSTFVRAVCLCSRCHQGIHSGRLFSVYQKQEENMTREKFFGIMEHVFRQIYKYNCCNPDKPELKLFDSWKKCLNDPTLKEQAEKTIERYEIKFYEVPESSWNKYNWSKWKMIYGDKEYGTRYANQGEWEKVYVGENVGED